MDMDEHKAVEQEAWARILRDENKLFFSAFLLCYLLILFGDQQKDFHHQQTALDFVAWYSVSYISGRSQYIHM